MAILNVDFGSPKTASIQEVNIVGTLGSDSPTYAVTITLDVLDDVTVPATPTHRYVYVTKEYVAGASYTSGAPDKVYMAITPRLTANELASSTPVSLLIAGDGGAFEGAMVAIV